MNLPATYYDVLFQQDPSLIKFVEEDIKYISGKGPFESVDEYSDFFHEYISQFKQSILQNMAMQLGYLDMEVIKNEFNTSLEYKQLIQSKSVDYVVLTNFCLFGRKTFFINSNLAEQMAYTNLEIDSEFVELPFLSCLLVFDDKTTIKALSDLDSQKNNILPDVPVSVFCNILMTEKGHRKLVFACWQSTFDENIIFVKRELLLRKGWKITDILKTEWTEVFSKDNDTQENLFGQENDDSLFYEEGITFFRIIINTILYLSSSGKIIDSVVSPRFKLEKHLSKIKNKAKKKKAKRNISKTSRLNCIYVGSGISSVTQKIGSTTDFNDNIRFMVRGHWRNQNYGNNMTEKKIIWIKPYFKGPEISELINKPYKVK